MCKVPPGEEKYHLLGVSLFSPLSLFPYHRHCREGEREEWLPPSTACVWVRLVRGVHAVDVHHSTPHAVITEASTRINRAHGKISTPGAGRGLRRVSAMRLVVSTWLITPCTSECRKRKQVKTRIKTMSQHFFEAFRSSTEQELLWDRSGNVPTDKLMCTSKILN